MSASRSYRNKISVSERLAPERDAMRRDVPKEPYPIRDWFHWPLKKKREYVLPVLGDKCCLMEVSAGRDIKTLKEFLSRYGGTWWGRTRMLDGFTSAPTTGCAWSTRSGW